MRLFKVFSATDGVHTIYSVLRSVVERSALHHLDIDYEIKEDTLKFSDEDIINLNKYHCLKFKTGFNEKDTLDAIIRAINNCDENYFSLLMNSATNEDKHIVESWFSREDGL